MLDLSKQQLRGLIDKLSFFEFFTSEEKTIIADYKSNMKGYSAGDHIIRQGETDQTVYLLLKGKAKITRNEKSAVSINTLKEGDVFGEIAFFSKRLRSTNVVALENAMVLKMDWTLFDELNETIKNKIKDKLIEILIQRLEEMNKLLIKHSRR